VLRGPARPVSVDQRAVLSNLRSRRVLKVYTDVFQKHNCGMSVLPLRRGLGNFNWRHESAGRPLQGRPTTAADAHRHRNGPRGRA
jgi:hypothetical protein